MGGIFRWSARKARTCETVGWYSELQKTCAALASSDVDVILATGGPWGTFQVARRLSRRLGRPFVLDYRDLWTSGNPHSSKFATRHYRRMEGNLLKDCSAASVVSPSMKTSLVEHFCVDAEKIHVVSNGYDPADFQDVAPYDFGHFAIVYAGMLYPPKGDISPLMRALSRLNDTHVSNDWRFHYYGPHKEFVRLAAKAHGVENKVMLHGMVSRHEVLSAVRGAGLAVVIASVYDSGTLGDRGIITGKIFEPIGLGTPVLVIAPPGFDVESVVETTGNGAVCAGSDIGGIAKCLTDLMNGKVSPRKHPEAYSWPRLILKMDAMLRTAAASVGRETGMEY